MFRRKKKYEITAKINGLFMKTAAYNDLTDRYVKENNHERAVECSEKYTFYGQKTWDEVFRVYPELKEKETSFNIATKTLTVEESEGK